MNLYKTSIMSIADNLEKIYQRLPERVRLIAISKTHGPEEIMTLYRGGHRYFGENKVQELLSKTDELPDDIQWHMVGHLQSNKVKYIAPFIAMIHAVDSLKLLKVINKEAKKNNRKIPCLLQLHIADEETKFGMSMEETRELLESDAFKTLEHVQICGLMGMATFTDDHDKVREEFRYLKRCFDSIRNQYFADQPTFNEISMGMSDDFLIGIEEGSTMVRIGSAIFGERDYQT